MKNVLYLSIDGLLDPLGQSQIFPYLNKLSETNLSFFVCTIENKKNKNKLETFKKKIKNNPSFNWNYFFFLKRKGKFNRLKEIILLYFLAIKIIFSKKIDILHSRSYLPMFFCILIKVFSKKKIIFDTRGSWFDERIDGGMLKKKGIDLFLFKFLKKIEFIFFYFSNHIVFLTDNGLQSVQNSYIAGKKYSVIPCAADYNFFNIIEKKEKDQLKDELKFEEKHIITYSGSIGSWYNFDQILDFFSRFNNINPNSRLIILTQSEINFTNLNLPLNLTGNITFMSSIRSEIPKIIGISDVTLCFINKSFSKKFSSPTKVAESLACGVPVIYNEGIGDLNNDMKEMNSGFELNSENFISLDCVQSIKNLQINKDQIRNNSYKKYSLEYAIKKYINIYKYL
jgi:glycosyltransferase involved in cell wall biosynthesis